MTSPFVTPRRLRFEGDVNDDELLRLSLFKANSPACSLTSDTLRTALTIAGFKDELLESLVAEL
jgi:hypothetical protein